MKRVLLYFLLFSSILSHSQQLNDNLLLHYTISENANDLSGNNFHGIVNATLTEDRCNNAKEAYTFNGIDKYIDFPNDPKLKPDFPISFAFWVKLDDLQAENAVFFTTDFAQNNHSGVWMNLSSTGKVAISYGDASGGVTSSQRRTKIGNTSLKTEKWYHLAGVVRGLNDMEIYINGVNDGGTYNGAANSIKYTNNTGSIGRKDGHNSKSAYYFKGDIDDFYYWNRSLSAKEVAQIHNGLSDNLLLHYTFNDNTNDFSGNDFHGTTNNSPLAVVDRDGHKKSAYAFNGINQYIDFPNNSKLKPNFPVSFAFWVKVDDLQAENGVFFTTDFTQNNHSGVWMNLSSTGKVAISYGDASGGVTSSQRRTKLGNTDLQEGQWYHLIGVIKNTNDMEIYINCVNDGGTYNGSATSMNYTSNVGSIGRKDGHGSKSAYYFKGQMDDFYYWDKALSSCEITKLCHTPDLITNNYNTNNEQKDVVVYPNPTEDILYIDNSNIQWENMILYNALGQIVYASEFENQLDISDLKEGVYFLKVATENEQQTIRVLKQ